VKFIIKHGKQVNRMESSQQKKAEKECDQEKYYPEKLKRRKNV